MPVASLLEPSLRAKSAATEDTRIRFASKDLHEMTKQTNEKLQQSPKRGSMPKQEEKEVKEEMKRGSRRRWSEGGSLSF